MHILDVYDVYNGSIDDKKLSRIKAALLIGISNSTTIDVGYGGEFHSGHTSQLYSTFSLLPENCDILMIMVLVKLNNSISITYN